MAKAYLVYMGARRLYQDSIEIVPAQEALPQMRALLTGLDAAR